MHNPTIWDLSLYPGATSKATLAKTLSFASQHILILSDPAEKQRPIPRGWYCNLKDQFERLDKEFSNRLKQDPSCRITGATLKGSKGITQIEEDPGTQRKHYFSQLVRSNKSLIDEELPDPDKVRKHVSKTVSSKIEMSGAKHPSHVSRTSRTVGRKSSEHQHSKANRKAGKTEISVREQK